MEKFLLAVRPAASLAVTLAVPTLSRAGVKLTEKVPLHPTVTDHFVVGVVAVLGK
jgi:hypothetical protein